MAQVLAPQERLYKEKSEITGSSWEFVQFSCEASCGRLLLGYHMR
jgi:hypothetical protein